MQSSLPADLLRSCWLIGVLCSLSDRCSSTRRLQFRWPLSSWAISNHKGSWVSSSCSSWSLWEDVCHPRKASHGLMVVFAFDMAWSERCGVYDGYTGALSQGASLKEQQRIKGHFCLAFNETVVGYPLWKLLSHVLAYIAKIECLQVMEMRCVEQHEDGHDFTVGHLSLALAMTLARLFYHMLFLLNLKIFTKFVEYTKKIY